MAFRAGLLLFLVLGASWACDARDPTKSVSSDDSVLQMKLQEFDSLVKASEEVSAEKNLCTLCEEFATEVLDFLEDNSTQTAVIDILYKTCSELPSVEEECTSLANYYVPLIFTEISSVKPKLFCQYVDLCVDGVITTPEKSDKCTVCQQAMAEILAKMKDPDTELEIIELLLKACNSASGRKNVQKCKRLVFKFGPLILESAPQLLEKLNLCKAIHACKSLSSGSYQKYLHFVS